MSSIDMSTCKPRKVEVIPPTPTASPEKTNFEAPGIVGNNPVVDLLQQHPISTSTPKMAKRASEATTNGEEPSSVPKHPENSDSRNDNNNSNRNGKNDDSDNDKKQMQISLSSKISKNSLTKGKATEMMVSRGSTKSAKEQKVRRIRVTQSYKPPRVPSLLLQQSINLDLSSSNTSEDSDTVSSFSDRSLMENERRDRFDSSKFHNS